MSSSSGQQLPDWADFVDDANKDGERFTKDVLIDKDLDKASGMTRDPYYMHVRTLVLSLSGGHADNKIQTGQLQLSQDEICNLSEILDNLVRIPTLKDKKSVAVWKKSLIRSKPNQPILLEVSDFRRIFDLMEWLLPEHFFAATRLERFTLRWRKESYEREWCQDISEFTKDPDILITLQGLDSLLRRQLLTWAATRSHTSISANCALVLLLRIKQYLDEGNTSIGGNAEVTFQVITTLMSADEDARIPISSQEVAVLNQLYDHLTGDLEPACEPADQQTSPSEYAKNLFKLELIATYWLEKMIDVTFRFLLEEKLTKDELFSRMNYVCRKLGEDTFKPFITKAALLEAFHRNIPTKPQNPCFLKPGHAHCVEEVTALEGSLQVWNKLAARLAYPLLDEFPGHERAKFGTRPEDILTGAVPKLVAMRKEHESELLEDRVLEEKARMEKFCTNAVKREIESRKKKDELRSEIRSKDRQIEELKKAEKVQPAVNVGEKEGTRDIAEQQRRLKEQERQLRDREESLKIQEADFKALQRKNQKTLQKESKVSNAQLRIEQGKVADLEKKLHTSNEALRTLQLDYDSVSIDLQEFKLCDSANKAKISSESDQQASIEKLKEDLQRYKGRWGEELEATQKQLLATQKQPANEAVEYEARLLADLATRDETIHGR